MSHTRIDDLAAATSQLRAAMQKSDLGDIETAMTRFRTSMEAVQAIGVWRADPQVKARIKDLIGELESSRMLACLLGDMAGQKHSAIAAYAPDAPQPLYKAR